MKNAKAIEIIDVNIKQRDPNMPLDVLDALRQGKKALEYVELVKEFPHLIDEIALPKETE